MTTTETNNDAKRIGGYLKEKWTIGISRISNDEVVRAIAKVTSHKLKTPNPKHMDRLIAASHGNYNTGGTKYEDINDWIVTELDKHTHSRNWVVVLKTLIVFHTLMVEGSDEMLHTIAKHRGTFNNNHMKDLADSPDGAAQESFIHSYARYLEERCVSYTRFRFHQRIENEDFVAGLLRLSPESAAAPMAAMLQQLEVFVDGDLHPQAMNNHASLHGFQCQVRDGKRLFVIATKRIMQMLDEFSNYSPAMRKAWVELLQKFHRLSKRLSELFVRMNNYPAVDFGEKMPPIQTMADSVVLQLEASLNDLDDEVQVHRSTLGGSAERGRGDGATAGPDTRSRSPDLFKKKPSTGGATSIPLAGQATPAPSVPAPPADPLGSIFSSSPSAVAVPPATSANATTRAAPPPTTSVTTTGGGGFDLFAAPSRSTLQQQTPPPSTSQQKSSAPMDLFDAAPSGPRSPPPTSTTPPPPPLDPFATGPPVASVVQQQQPQRVPAQAMRVAPPRSVEDDLFGPAPAAQPTVAPTGASTRSTTSVATPPGGGGDFDFFAPTQPATAPPAATIQKKQQQQQPMDLFGQNPQSRAW